MNVCLQISRGIITLKTKDCCKPIFIHFLKCFMAGIFFVILVYYGRQEGGWGYGSEGGGVRGFEMGVEIPGRTIESPRGSTLPHSQGGN
jgi:hypothetical protein